jgi:rhodanese-related sulfurtransferase
VKFIIDNIYLIALAIISGAMLFVPFIKQRQKGLSTLEATQLMNKGKTVVVDIRTPEQFAKGHLVDARNIPLKDLAQRTDELSKFKDKNVIVTCQSGTQSGKAVAQLKKAGFANVYALQGGVAAWQTQNLPTVASGA